MPRVDVVALVQDDLGVGVCGYELGGEHGADRIRHGDRVADQRVEVGGRDGAISVGGAEVSWKSGRVSWLQKTYTNLDERRLETKQETDRQTHSLFAT